jgi:hypothetical protein
MKQVSTNSRALNNPLQYIRSQQNKTRPQQQKKSQKVFKYMEIEQHTAEKPMVD